MIRPLIRLPFTFTHARRAGDRHDDMLRADRFPERPNTSLIALVNGGRGAL